jgi:glycine cleavage system transcriptional repressor
VSPLAITAVGADRPGIIARITGALAERGGNLEDCTMTVLSGHFAIMLLVAIDAAPDDLERELEAATEDLGLVITVRTVDGGDVPAPPTHLLSVYGSDRPGLLREVTGVLAERDVNVTDLTTRVIGGEHAVYAMALEIAVAPDDDAEALRAAVADAVAGVEVSLQPIDAPVL